jgi:hypothetical protein
MNQILLAGATPIAGVACSHSSSPTAAPTPGSAREACNSIRANPSLPGVNGWAASRAAAGNSADQIGKVLFDARKICPDIKSVIEQTNSVDGQVTP